MHVSTGTTYWLLASYEFEVGNECIAGLIHENESWIPILKLGSQFWNWDRGLIESRDLFYSVMHAVMRILFLSSLCYVVIA